MPLHPKGDLAGGRKYSYHPRMSKIDKISIAIPSDMLGEIRTAVDAGEYATTSEVVREALRDWRAKRRLQQAEIEELRRLIREGDESGQSITAEDVLTRLRERYGAA